MLSYANLQNKPRVLQSLTGLTVAEFEQLLVSFEQAWQGYVEQHSINQTRQRHYGGGRSPKLKSTCDKLLFILAILRTDLGSDNAVITKGALHNDAMNQ